MLKKDSGQPSYAMAAKNSQLSFEKKTVLIVIVAVVLTFITAVITPILIMSMY